VSERQRDYFEKARIWACTALFLGAALLFLGSFLDWVSVERLPETIPSDQARFAEPFNGFDVGDGWVTTGTAVVMWFCAVMIVLTAKGSFAWLAFVASIVAGAVSISDYRDISGLFEQFGGIGRGVSPGIGITLAAAGSLVSLVSSVAAVAATPNAD
jgi:hypothetical protein